jgi:hypothetical protein
LGFACRAEVAFGRSGITAVTAGLPTGSAGRVVAFDFVLNKATFL